MNFIEVFNKNEPEPRCINLDQITRVDRAVVDGKSAVSILQSDGFRVIFYMPYDEFLTTYLGFKKEELKRPV